MSHLTMATYAKYPKPQIYLHWSIVILVITAYAAIYAGNYNLHKLAGFLVLLLSLVRLVFLKVYKKRIPEIVPPIALSQKIVATLVKIALALAFIGIPLSGIIMSMAGRGNFGFYGIELFSSIDFKDPELARNARAAHIFMANACYALIGLHAAGAIYHHVIRKDNTLKRMLPH